MKNKLEIFIGFFIIILLFAGCTSDLLSPEEANPYMRYVNMEIDPLTQMTVALIEPECYNASLSYPVLIALPPGDQTKSQVQWAIDTYYIRQSIQRQWIVVSPSAINDVLYHEGSEAYIPMLLEAVELSYQVEGDQFHLAGISNGGTSAFRIATLYPDRFQSLTVFPGVPLEVDFQRLNRIVNIPITMYVGALDDSELIAEMDSTVSRLETLGAQVTYRKWANDGHVITSLTPEHMFDLFDSYRIDMNQTSMISKNYIPR